MSNGPRVLTEENKRWVVNVIYGHIMTTHGNVDEREVWKEAQKMTKTLAARILAVTSLDDFDAFEEYRRYKENKGG